MGLFCWIIIIILIVFIVWILYRFGSILYKINSIRDVLITQVYLLRDYAISLINKLDFGDSIIEKVYNDMQALGGDLGDHLLDKSKHLIAYINEFFSEVDINSEEALKKIQNLDTKIESMIGGNFKNYTDNLKVMFKQLKAGEYKQSLLSAERAIDAIQDVSKIF